MRLVMLMPIALATAAICTSALADGGENDPKIVVHVPKNQYASVYVGRFRAEASQLKLWTNRNGHWEVIAGPADPYYIGSGNSCAGEKMRLWQKAPKNDTDYELKVTAREQIGDSDHEFGKVVNTPRPHMTQIDYFSNPANAEGYQNTRAAVYFSPDGVGCSPRAKPRR